MLHQLFPTRLYQLHQTDATLNANDVVEVNIRRFTYLGGCGKRPATGLWCVVQLRTSSESRTLTIEPTRTGTYESYSDGLFTPAEDLSALSTNEFTTLAHPAFPRYSIRMKKSTDFCDTTVKCVIHQLLHTKKGPNYFERYSSYTGYIDIEARHLFFYFFESRNDPDKDDVIFWTNGGEFPYLLAFQPFSHALSHYRTRLLLFTWSVHGTRPMQNS